MKTSNHWKPRRRPVRQAAALLAVIALGLFSRSHFTAGLPHIVTKAAGDALWTTMFFIAFSFVRPRAATRALACAVFAFSCMIEFSQLYHAPWIEGLRGIYIGGVILGFGFHATDFIWYAIGTFVAVAIDRTFLTE
jgi:hypothetical protein